MVPPRALGSDRNRHPVTVAVERSARRLERIVTVACPGARRHDGCAIPRLREISSGVAGGSTVLRRPTKVLTSTSAIASDGY